MGERKAPVPGVDLLFTDEDAVEILEYIEDEVLIHAPCGQPLFESTAKVNSYAYRAHALQCHACAAKARRMRQLDDRDGVEMIVEKLF
jgi:hypothetical protein